MVRRELVNLFFPEKNKSRESLFAMGHVLKQERIRQGHSIKIVAGSVGLTSAYISQLENGKKLNPTFRVISDYSDFLRLDMLDLALRMRVTETPGPDELDALISGMEDSLKTLRAIKKMEEEQ